MDQYIFKATCTKVVDGDTIDCTVDLGFQMTTKQRFRLHGINTPELHSKDPLLKERARAAKDFLTDLVLNETLMVQTYKSDAFGRYLAKIFIPIADRPSEYTLVNDLMIVAGFAEPFMVETSLLN